MGEPLVITAALTGCVHPASTPGLPITPEQVAADAARCADEGASVFHVHARDANGDPAWLMPLYRDYVDAVRDAVPGAVVCVSLSGRHFPNFGHRTDALGAGADMATFPLGSVDWPERTEVNSQGFIESALKIAACHNVCPWFEAFDLSHVYRLRSTALLVSLFVGALLPAEPRLMRQMIDLLPENATFSCVGLGQTWRKVAGWSVVWGGHVRVGMEYALEGGTNQAMVTAAAELGRQVGREPATPEQAREVLGLDG